MESLKILKVNDLNEYDLQRILRENVNLLEKKNNEILAFMKPESQLPGAVTLGFAAEVLNNAAEILYILTVSDKNSDLQTYTDASPLFREKGDVR